MRTPLSLFMALVLCSSGYASGASRISPQEIAASVRANGAKATVNMLNSAPGAEQWESVLKQIKTGDPRWLAIAADLAAGTDAGTSEALQTSLAAALPKNPSGVLLLADTQSFLSLRDLCSAPFIEPSRAYLMKYLKQARRALRNLNDAKAEPRRSACLAEIDRTLSEELQKAK
jgi:hypothetical protein